MDFTTERAKLTFTSDLSALGLTQTGLQRSANKGSLVRVLHGAYVESDEWSRLDAGERHRLRAIAAAKAADDSTVFSHHAAAAIWGLPILGAWPAHVDVTTQRRSGGRSSGNLRRHCVGIDSDDLRYVDGIWVTSPARTVVDLAKILGFMDAVAVMDAAAHRKRAPRLTTLDEIRAVAHTAIGSRGWRRAVAAADFATDLSDSTWESASRVQIFFLGFPTPILQHRFYRTGGRYDEVDFWWPEFGVIGEFDGLVKYLSARYRRQLTPEQVVVKEKIREDRLRRPGRKFARWVASDVREPNQLCRILVETGLPRVR